MKINIASNELVHFIGIGGIGMSGLAQIMKNMGFTIQGSDLNKNKNTDRLMKLGIKVFIGHHKKNLNKATMVVISSAIKKNNNELVDTAFKLKNTLQSLRIGRVVVENTGNIGKNYRKHDEIGTPLCITVDFDTLETGVVTIRNRDTMLQEKMSLEDVSNYFKDFFLK